MSRCETKGEDKLPELDEVELVEESYELCQGAEEIDKADQKGEETLGKRKGREKRPGRWGSKPSARLSDSRLHLAPPVSEAMRGQELNEGDQRWTNPSVAPGDDRQG